MNLNPTLSWLKANAERFKGALLWNEPLGKHTYYKIGGPTPLLFTPECKEDLSLLKTCLTLHPHPYLFLGMGSNVLVSDSGTTSIVIKTSKICFDLDETGGFLNVGSSVSVTTLLRESAKRGLSGFESLTGIPGSVGGVIFMNAGTHLGEAKDGLVGTRSFLFEGKEDWVNRSGDELQFEYRKNHFIRPDELVYSSTWKFTRKDPAEVKRVIDETLTRRKSTQPLEYPSCGSVFKNPHPKKAWEVIESLGLRGKKIGNAAFSEKHPNFIVNLGGALAQDVWDLIQLAKKEAREKLGIELQEEVRLIGEFK